MKSSLTRKSFIALLLGAGTCFAPCDAWARLLKPIQLSGVVLALDLDTQTFVFKLGKGKKPFLLDWNKDTKFESDGQPASAAELKPGTPVVIYYREVSFHNPLLKKVLWINSSAPK
jgi:hypothetical protein